MERAQIESIILDMAGKARRAARVIGALPTAVKNRILLDVGEALLARQDDLLAENERDLAAADACGITAAMRNRLQIGPEERILHSTLAEFPAAEVDMFTVVVIGNAETFRFRDFLVTPRGFSSRKPVTGPAIRQESFRLIADRLTRTDLSPAPAPSFRRT